MISESSQQTEQVGERLGRALKKGDIVCFFGNLGSGKTTFIKGIARGLKIKASKVNSPTFVLMNIYGGRLPLFHFDLYRIKYIREIDALGYDEFFYDDGVAVIEWAQRLKGYLPAEYLKIELMHKGPTERVVLISSSGKRYEKYIQLLSRQHLLRRGGVSQ